MNRELIIVFAVAFGAVTAGCGTTGDTRTTPTATQQTTEVAGNRTTSTTTDRTPYDENLETELFVHNNAEDAATLDLMITGADNATVLNDTIDLSQDESKSYKYTYPSAGQYRIRVTSGIMRNELTYDVENSDPSEQISVTRSSDRIRIRVAVV